MGEIQQRELTGVEGAIPRRSRSWRLVKIFGWFGAVAILVLIGVGEYVLHHAEPILRKRIVETLSARFDAPVELTRLDISLFKGIEVDGYGLRIPAASAGEASGFPYPLIAVRHFAFRTSLRSLFSQPMHVAGVRVEGMEIHIPSSAARDRLFGRWKGNETADAGGAGLKPKVAIEVDELRCREVELFLEPGRPDKDPLLFRIAALEMRHVGPGQSMHFDARLTNPKPRGEVHAFGHFGPWGGRTVARDESVDRAEDPGLTPLDGAYTFDHADLSTIRGLGGTLSSTGRFGGVLHWLVVDGETETPDFSLDISNHAVPLHTEFHAIVDGTTGDTYLEPVRARLAGSEFTAAGKIVKVKGRGHDINLDVDIPHGRMQDFLRLAMKTSPPVVNGTLAMKARFHLPPGPERVPVRMNLAGRFQLSGVVFNNKRLQDRLDGLSARAQGHPEEAKRVGEELQVEASSQLGANFTLAGGLATVRDVRYSMPGALVLMNGVYSMDGRLFEFKGHVRTEATVSQMVGAWKGWLLKPVDGMLRKDGAGLELPIEISGTEGDMQVGLALHGTDDSPRQMLTEVRGRERAQRELKGAREEAALADREDAEAAKAPTLAAAEEAHRAAVQHRAEAQRRAEAARAEGGGP